MKKVLLFFALLFAGIQFAAAQNLQVSGKVTSADDGLPVIGATIKVEGTSVATLSDVNGMYKINVPSSSSKELVVTYAGMVDGRATAASNGQVINFVLQTNSESLESVQVIGYGSARKVGSIVGSVQQVTAKSIQNRPTPSVLDALQGQVAGLQVYTSSGEPSAVQSVRLHGVGSLGTGSTPLYILDGVPVSSGDILSMNPNDFESMTVMKDAAATSIYGSRAANGVIYITSKRGTRGDARITVSGQYGISTQANKSFYDKMMSTTQLWGMWKENGIATQADFDSWTAKGYDKNNTDWFRFYQKEFVPVYQGDISISGGSEKTSYYISGGMYHQEGSAAKSFYDRYTFRSNVESKVKSWMTVGANIQLSYSKRNSNSYYGTNNGNGGLSYFLAPFYSPFKPDGSVYYDEIIPGLNMYNPDYLASKTPLVYEDFGTVSSAFITLEPVKNLKITSRAGLNYTDRNINNQGLPSFEAFAGNGYMQRTSYGYLDATITNTVEYAFNVAPEHELSFLVGHEGISSQTDYFFAETDGLTDDRLMQLQFGDKATYNEKSWIDKYAFLSFFGRVGYNYADKVFFDATVRNDASSRFSPNHRNATFWSVGARWNLSKEDFLKNSKVVTGLSLKASYGSQGNADIGNYAWQATIGETTNRYNQNVGWSVASPGSPNLTWETQYKLTVGASIQLWNMLNIDVEYYRRNTKDMLMDVPQPGTTGYTEITQNVGGMQNAGVDIVVGLDILRGKDYSLSFSAVFNYNEEKITSLFGGRSSWVIPNTSLGYIVGQPVMYYAPVYAGVNSKTGLQQWYLPGNDPKVTQRDPNKVTSEFDEAALEQNTGVKLYAPISGGFSISGSWKGLALQADFSYVIGKNLLSNDRFFTENPNVFRRNNQSDAVLDHWKKPGDVAPYPDWSQGERMQFDTHLISDASFMRLKNLTLSYAFPKKVFQKQKVVSGFKVYATARNLFTLSSFPGIDPEADTNVSMGMIPNSQQFIFGVELVF